MQTPNITAPRNPAAYQGKGVGAGPTVSWSVALFNRLQGLALPISSNMIPGLKKAAREEKNRNPNRYRFKMALSPDMSPRGESTSSTVFTKLHHASMVFFFYNCLLYTSPSPRDS